MFYAIFMFQKYSKIDKIEIKFIYVEHDYDNSIVLERKYLENYKKQLLDLVNSVETSTFQKNPTKLCGWCDYEEFCKTDV